MPSCSYDRRAQAYCDLGPRALPRGRRYVPTQPTWGGFSLLMDYCPVTRAYADGDCTHSRGYGGGYWGGYGGEYGGGHDRGEERCEDCRCLLTGGGAGSGEGRSGVGVEVGVGRNRLSGRMLGSVLKGGWDEYGRVETVGRRCGAKLEARRV